MFKTLNDDRKTIERKYHIPGEEFNPFLRWNHHGYEYDTTTGLDDVEIDEGLLKLSEEISHLSHPVQKAKLFEYVLQNTRIDVNEHDYFIGIYTWCRPILKYTIDKWRDEVYKAHPEEAKILGNLSKSGCGGIGLDFDHTVPDWDSLFELGFKGILRRAEENFNKIENPTEKQKDFLEGITIEYGAIIDLIDRMYKYSLMKKFDKAPRISNCLKNLRDGAPSDTYEVLQMIYIYFMVSEHIENYQVRTLGHGLDTSLLPYYKKDLESGTYTKEEIGEMMGYFLMQFSAIGNYWGQPMYLGGINSDGSTRVTELSHLILDVYNELGIYNPKIQIKINKNTPKDFVLKALDMIRSGVSSIVFCNDDIITKSLMSKGATYNEAIDSVITGCYEYKKRGKGCGISGGFINALKPISLIFDNGTDTLTNIKPGLETGDLDKIDSFEKFYSLYLQQLGYIINSALDAIYVIEGKIEKINPAIIFSASLTDCIDKMALAHDNGTENDSGVTLSGLGSAVDALMSVYELVYEKKIVTLNELKTALDADWVGYEDLQRRALSCPYKYGNGHPMPDNYAAAITTFVHDIVSDRRNSHGGRIGFEIHSARAFIDHGEMTKATPDGRKFGKETSKNASPTQGADKNGITALINSATTIDSSLSNSGFCLDAMLHPSAVQNEDGLYALYSVLITYMNKGGASIHFNIFSADKLRDAQKNPEKYKNLQVRVCGWNTLWNNMCKEEQEAYILRAENIM